MVSLRKRIAKRKFTDPRMNSLLREMLKAKGEFWKNVAKILSKPRRKRVVVNVSKLQRISKVSKIVVPGKVLGAGVLNKKLEVAAYAFSEKAKEKIEKAGGKAILIEEALKKNPEGEGMKIVM